MRILWLPMTQKHFLKKTNLSIRVLNGKYFSQKTAQYLARREYNKNIADELQKVDE